MRHFLHVRQAFILPLLLTSIQTWSQCPSGAIGISGGGCMSGCNLTLLGGPNCIPPVTGNTPSPVSVFTDIIVPPGCTFTVTATMSNRTGSCSASGADAGDGMKVDIPGGTRPLQAGGGNATLNDSYTLVGPGTVRVSCTANRQDEIVTYAATSSGALCVSCLSILPIGLSEFIAVKGPDYVDLLWTTLSERDNELFTIERSEDGHLFDAIGWMDGAVNSSAPISYTNRDVYPLDGTSYYRLKQTDTDGKFTYSEIRTITFEDRVGIYPNPANDRLIVITGKKRENSQIALINSIGQEIDVPFTDSNGTRTFDTGIVPEGIYFATILLNGKTITQKVAITH